MQVYFGKTFLLTTEMRGLHAVYGGVFLPYITCQIIMSSCHIFMLTGQMSENYYQTSHLISCFHSVLMPLTAIYLSV